MASRTRAPNAPRASILSKTAQPETFSTAPVVNSMGMRRVPEPMGDAERKTYGSQLLIPVGYSNQVFAMSGPLSTCITDPTKIEGFFPAHEALKPIGCSKKAKDDTEDPAKEKIDLRFFNRGVRAFRSSPSLTPEYTAWLNKMEECQASIWKGMGIYDLVMLSKTGLNYCPDMLVASLLFWDYTHYTFHLPCGMVTPTLFDVAAITGLRPTGDYFDPEEMSEDQIGFSATKPTYTTYTNHYHDKSTDVVTDVEHITFLALWLSRFVFCMKSLQVTKKMVTLATQLHHGQNICLDELILANLYESISNGATQLKVIKNRASLLLAGPFWLLQL